mmetsp:Transcript_5325/g.11272  ORF Transcript_5325/g.11272 Transcript_5325/m.11272 type:complete len:207 (-) Transcript_5325:962-1582(-)
MLLNFVNALGNGLSHDFFFLPLGGVHKGSGKLLFGQIPLGGIGIFEFVGNIVRGGRMLRGRLGGASRCRSGRTSSAVRSSQVAIGRGGGFVAIAVAVLIVAAVATAATKLLHTIGHGFTGRRRLLGTGFFRRRRGRRVIAVLVTLRTSSITRSTTARFATIIVRLFLVGQQGGGFGWFGFSGRRRCLFGSVGTKRQAHIGRIGSGG